MDFLFSIEIQKSAYNASGFFFSYGIVGDYFTQTPVDIKRDYSSLIKELNGMLCISHPIKVLKRAKQTSLMKVKIILKIRM